MVYISCMWPLTHAPSWRINIVRLASINKSTHVGQPVFSVLFALLSLAGDSPPASRRTKIPRKSKAVRCEAVLPELKCSQTRKRPQRILRVFSRALTPYEGTSARQNRVCPCQSTLTILANYCMAELFHEINESSCICVDALYISLLQNGLLQSTNRSLRKIGRIRFSSISSISRKDVTALQTV